MNTVILQCHHSSHAEVPYDFLQGIVPNPAFKFMTIPDISYQKDRTRIDYPGDIASANTYANIPNRSVTAYVNMFCSQNIKDAQAGLAEIDRTLKPGGYYIFSRLDVPNVKQDFNDTAEQFFLSKRYIRSKPFQAKIQEKQPEAHMEVTYWYMLKKPLAAGKRKTRRRKTHRKRINRV